MSGRELEHWLHLKWILCCLKFSLRWGTRCDHLLTWFKCPDTKVNKKEACYNSWWYQTQNRSISKVKFIVWIIYSFRPSPSKQCLSLMIFCSPIYKCIHARANVHTQVGVDSSWEDFELNFTYLNLMIRHSIWRSTLMKLIYII